MDKKILTVLGVSLALNFMFIGFEVSRICCCPTPHIPPARPAFIPEGPMGKFVPPGQNMMKDVFKNHEKDLKKAKKAFEEALTKEPFDAGQFKEALQKAAAVRQSVDEDVQEKMVEMISKMTPEERRRFADGFSKAKEHFKHNANKMKPGRHGRGRHGENFRFDEAGQGEFVPPHDTNENKELREDNPDAPRLSKREIRRKMRNKRKSRKEPEKPVDTEKQEAPVQQETEQPAAE